MALQDLTPQLRTRLSRMERVVGLFVSLATLLLLAGFVYYVYHTAQRKGWLVTKVLYWTQIANAAGLKEGDPVKCMGFDAGQITQILPMPPTEKIDEIYVAFVIKHPYFGYVWTDSEVKIGSADFFGNRYLEVTKGGSSGKTNYTATYKRNANGDLEMWIDAEPDKNIVGHFESVKSLKPKTKQFKGYQLLTLVQPPALSEQITRAISQIEAALPNVLNLTNQLTAVLTNSANLVSNLNHTVATTHPIISNLTAISAQLREPQGSLGEWLIPTNINRQLQTALGSANSTLNRAETNLQLLAANLNKSLDNVSDLTSNLNAQVQANSLIVSEISSLVVNADEFVQGLKRNWLLKGAFQNPTNKPVQSILQPSVGGAK